MNCPNCNAALPKSAKFCTECGTSVSVLLAPASTSSMAHRAERRQLSVMFCDVVNSTTLSGELDPEELRDLMRHYQEACAKVIRRFDGEIAKYLGDGLLVQFGYPTAHEDDAQRAVRAGLGMLDAVRLADFHTSSGIHVPIDVRIGIHTGLVLIDQIGSEAQRVMDIVGETPNIAARLQGLAEPNSLLISNSTYKLVAGFFELEDLGSQKIKGVAQPMEVYRVRHESAAKSRFEASRVADDAFGGVSVLVGRSSEMANLQARWAETCVGKGHAIFVSGEAGIGKSRIALAMKELVANESDAWLVETQCSPYYQNTAYYPIANLFERTILQFNSNDDSSSRLAKLEGYLVQNGLDLDENVPLLQPLLSLQAHPRYRPLDPLSSRTKQRTMDLLMKLLLQRAAQQPILFVAEDLHWADPSTLELLSLVLTQVPTSHILAILTFRPEFSAPWVIAEDTIALGRLQQEETRAMVEHLVRQKHLPREIAEHILAKTDGVPLFVEELTRTIIESGSLIEQGDRFELVGKLQSDAVPSTLKDSLMARLDRMAASKRVAQVASVLGREFTYPLLEAIFPGDKSSLADELSQLVSAGLVFQSGGISAKQAAGAPLKETTQARDVLFTFKHALVQDAAYDSLLKTERQQYHLATATALRDVFPDLYARQPELVAQHFTAACRFEAAIPEWLRAGKQADTRSANQEASSHYRKGMELLTELPADSLVRGYELPLQLSYGMSVIMVRGYSVPEVATAITRARELCCKMGTSSAMHDAPELPMVLWALWAFYVVRGDLNVSIKFAEEFLEVGKRRNDGALLIEANSMFVLEHLLAGNFIDTQKQMDECIERYSVEKYGMLAYQFTQDPLVVAGTLGSWNEYALGYPDRARAVCTMVLEHARKLGHNFSLNYAVAFSAWLYYFMEMPDEVERLANETLQIATENGYALWAGDALILLGWVQHQRGNSAQGLELINQGLGIFNAIGRASGLPGNLDIKAEVLIALGKFEEARALLDERWELSERTNQGFRQSIGLRMEAELIRASSPKPHTEDATKRMEEFYQQSVADARKRSARTFELKTLLRLFDLVHGTDREPEIQSQIQVLYSSFTEGFDAPLLQQAARIAGGAAVIEGSSVFKSV
jgi:predicted ATPase/class 3 adenylate cyclase